jgi:hypothetical protein
LAATVVLPVTVSANAPAVKLTALDPSPTVNALF